MIDTDGLFPSDAVMATPTIANGKKVRDVVVEDREDGAVSLNNADNNSKLNILELSNRLSNDIFKQSSGITTQSYSKYQTIDETRYCSDGGSITLKGNADNTNGGNFTISYNNCQVDNITINGSVYSTITNHDSYADEFKDLTMKYTSDFTYIQSSPYKVVTIKKNSYINTNITDFDYSGNAEKFKFSISIVADNSSTEDKFGLRDCIYYYDNSGSDTEFYQTYGRVYINNLSSYVDYDTSYDMSATPFVINSSGDLQSGEARYNMANNGKVKIKVDDNQVHVYIDTNGDGIFELSEL